MSKQMKLAMSVGVGKDRHYTLDFVRGRHFIQTAERAGLPTAMASRVLEEAASGAGQAREAMEKLLPAGFPEKIHASVRKAVLSRVSRL